LGIPRGRKKVEIFWVFGVEEKVSVCRFVPLVGVWRVWCVCGGGTGTEASIVEIRGVPPPLKLFDIPLVLISCVNFNFSFFLFVIINSTVMYFSLFIVCELDMKIAAYTYCQCLDDILCLQVTNAPFWLVLLEIVELRRNRTICRLRPHA